MYNKSFKNMLLTFWCQTSGIPTMQCDAALI